MSQLGLKTYFLLAFLLLTVLASVSFSATKNKGNIMLFQMVMQQNVFTGGGDSSLVQKEGTADSAGVNGGLPSANTVVADSSLRASVADSVAVKKQALEAVVNYTAKDSIIFEDGNWAHLYGDAQVKYKDLGLKAENMTTNLDSSTVWAKHGVDSLGNEIGIPEFSQGESDKYEAKTIKYNFKSKKGYITQVVTQQGEGYIVSEQAKKNDDGSFFLKGGKYTTCDDHDHPHFYLYLTKAKVQPKKNVVTGPAYLVVADVPLPIAIPFAFFPFSSSYSSGVIPPSYVDELERGFGLRNGGYYWAINDHVDLALTGEIYTKGSWGLNAESAYRKRYRYSGNFSASYLLTKTGDKEVPSSYSVAKDFSLRWSHSQDPKANTYRTLSASVNFQTSSYNHNNLDAYNTSNYVSNTRSSSVNISQTFPNSKWSLNASMNIAQRSSDSTVSVTLPSLNVNMSRVYPFKRKNAVGSERWYEKIYLSYAGVLSNSITTKEDLLFRSNIIKDWKNGIRHSVPIGASFSLFNYINVTPTFNYEEQWHTHKTLQRFDASTYTFVPTDTVYGFGRTYNFSTALSFQTKLYGFYKPLLGLGKHVQAIRHVFTPSISLSYNPDFTSRTFGFWHSFDYLDASGELQTARYSPYATNLYSPSSSTKSGSVNFSLQNNLEMKVRSDKDSTGWKVVSLVDNFTASTSYNMMAESFRWSNINTSTRLKFSNSLTVNLNAVFDPYLYELNTAGTGLRRVDRLRISRKASLGRLMSTGYSFSPSLNQDSFKKILGLFSKNKDDKQEGKSQQGEGSMNEPDGETSDGMNSRSQASANDVDADGYVKNDIRWNLSASYSFNYAYDMSRFDPKSLEYKYRLTHNLSLSGSIQPTKNWSFTFNTSYDFQEKKFPYMSCSLSRDLHCFMLSATFIPIGPTKTYFVSLRVKSSLLQDLKYEQRNRSSSSDPIWP